MRPLGPDPWQAGDMDHIWKSSGIELEADPRLAELVVKSLGDLNANGKVTTPIAKEKLNVPDADDYVDGVVP